MFLELFSVKKNTDLMCCQANALSTVTLCIVCGERMAREFTRNMFIMLAAIMIGAIIITFFVADIVNRSKIETLTYEHSVEIEDINSRNENFTNYFLQGSIMMDSAREDREVGNYYFDFALFWYNTALRNITETYIQRCIFNCTEAMATYLTSYEHFDDSQPFFTMAMNFTEKSTYLEVLGYYLSFAQAGKNITYLRYNASNYLRQAAENLSAMNMSNVAMLMDLFNETEFWYDNGVQNYDDLKDQIDGYLFFNEIREIG